MAGGGKSGAWWREWRVGEWRGRPLLRWRGLLYRMYEVEVQAAAGVRGELEKENFYNRVKAEV